MSCENKKNTHLISSKSDLSVAREAEEFALENALIDFIGGHLFLRKCVDVIVKFPESSPWLLHAGRCKRQRLQQEIWVPIW